MVVFTLLINRVDQLWIVLLCAAAVVFNVFALPIVTKGQLEYPSGRFSNIGLITYPSVLLFLSVLFFESPIFLAIGWACMAFGDGFAGLIGANVKSTPIPWCKNKSFLGSLSFILFGSLGVLVILRLVPNEIIHQQKPHNLILITFTVALIASLAETIKGFIDDNITVAITSSFLFYLFFYVQPYRLPELSTEFIPGIIVCFSFSAVAYFSKSLVFNGAITGFLVAVCSFVGFGWPGLAMLFLFVLGGIGATKWRKNRLALPEDLHPRDYRNVLSNGVLASIVGLIAFLTDSADSFLFIIFASIYSAALSDTLSSELGTLYGHRFYQFPNFKRAENGTDGAISLEGTSAGICGSLAACVTCIYIMNDIIPGIIVLVSGVLANFFDSFLGTLFQKKRLMNNHTVNVANTFFAGLSAYFLLRLL